MTTAVAAPARQASAARMLPPWLWVWLGADLLAGIPSNVSELRYQVTLYFGNSFATRTITTLPLTLLRLSALVAVVPLTLLATAAVATAFPRLRGAWVERRFGLVCDDRPVIAEMQRFVDEHDPSIRLMVTIRADQMARIYPVGWRTARIAVFRPLTALWRTDRQAAQAILAHEIAHHRQGDQLIVGLGSPLTLLVKVWAAAFVLLMLAPLSLYFAAGGGELAKALSAQSVLELGQLPEALLLPVTALWLAEFSADQLTARAVGPDALRRALLTSASSRSPLIARAFALLSHPPRRLRLRAAAGRPAGLAVLLAAWPAAVVAQVLVTTAVAVPAELLINSTWRQIINVVLGGTQTFLLTGRILLIASVTVLLIWPVLARPWQWIWSGRLVAGPRRPWWPYFAAALLPAVLLILPAVPIRWSIAAPAAAPARPPSTCARLAAWNEHGQPRKELALTDLRKILTPTRPAVYVRNVSALAIAAKAALADKPPGAARPSYVAAMTDLVTITADLRRGLVRAAAAETQHAIQAYTTTDEILIREERGCVRK